MNLSLGHIISCKLKKQKNILPNRDVHALLTFGTEDEEDVVNEAAAKLVPDLGDELGIDEVGRVHFVFFGLLFLILGQLLA